MTKEEIAHMIPYSDENKICYRQCLSVVGVSQ